MSSTEASLNVPAAAPKSAAFLPLAVRTAWGLAAVLGGVLLFAAVSKAYEPLKFVKQIAEYKILPWHLSHVALAWVVLGVESALGAALLVGYRLRWTLMAAIALFIIFLGAVGWAWASGATADCGCFGSWAKRTPAQAFGEDALMLAGGAVALWLLRQQPGDLWKSAWRVVVVSAFAGIGLIMPVTFGLFANPTQQAMANAETGFQNVKISGITVDLQHGEHLVALIDTNCEHCQASVPTFNAYLTAKDLPGFVALCANEEWKRKFFVDRYKAKFPLGGITVADFDRLLGPTGDTPHIMLLREGKVIKVWDVTPPPIEELQKLHSK